LSIGYRIDASVYNLVVCRLRLYTVALFNLLSPFYLILASVDRVLIKSRNALTQRRSTRRLAYICILIGSLFWAVFHCHALIFSTITQIGPTSFMCYYRQGAHLAFMDYYALNK
jgi:hypothetical protein